MQADISLTPTTNPSNISADNTKKDDLKKTNNPHHGLRTSSIHANESLQRGIIQDASPSNVKSTVGQSNQFNLSNSLGNLSFINVVGLPYHPRQSSVPSSTTLRSHVGNNSTTLSNHFRNVSEPSTAPPRPPRSNQISVNNIHVQKNQPTVPKGAFSEPSSPYNGGTSGSSRTANQLTGYEDQTTRLHKFPEQKSGTLSGTPNNQINENVSNVNVNFYRAVAMNIISSVPTIKCLNTHTGKNVSNVQIMPLNGTTDQNSSSASVPCTTSITSSQVTVHNKPTQLMSSSANETISSVYLPNRVVPERTFTSTEAQTDDISLCYTEINEKERRRRARRERRAHRRPNPVNSRIITEESTTQSNGSTSSTLPDILDSHLPPPYSPNSDTFRQHQQLHGVPGRPMSNVGMVPPPVLVPPPQILRGVVPPALVPGMLPPPRPRTNLQSIVPTSGVPNVTFQPPNVISGQVPLVQNVPDGGNPGFRFALPVGQFRREHFSEEAPKGCCGVLSWKPGSVKWFIASIALVAVGCVLVGTALGTMRPAGRDHITVALLMIGIGIVLVTISGIAWRLASQNATSCRTMLGIGSLESIDVCTRRFVPRLPPTYGRPHHPYAAMMYPEFQYRPPPPTYQASMQEYRLRLLLIDRGNTPQIQGGAQSAVSPPPTYRSHNGSLIRDPIYSRHELAWSEYSCPPSYRSQTYSTRLGMIQDAVAIHTRNPSLSSSERTNENIVEVVNVHRSCDDNPNLETIAALDSKTEQESNSYKLILEECSDNYDSTKEGNLVTIVQTDDRSPVIVTVSSTSGIESTSNDSKLPSEIQILAHL